MTEKNAKMLACGFLSSVHAFGNRPAIEVSGEILTYVQLFQKAASLAATLTRHEMDREPPLTAVFAYRSVTAFAGVLAALLRGHGYVPLNRTFPADRTRTMLQRSGCRAVIVDTGSAGMLEEVLGAIENPLLVVLPDHDDAREYAAILPQHRCIGRSEMEGGDSFQPVTAPPDAIAYLLFTSGSTGQPKGVMVSQRNVRAYVDFVVPRYGITETDRCSQTFDMTFDLSAHDMFVTWEKGACLCCPSQKTLLKPGTFINEARLTTWFSVPSTGIFMKRFGELKAGAYPGLRLSLFCGEALPMEVAKGWAEAAPNSVVENIYGPTELTIACTAYRWDPVRSPAECEQGIVPIGQPFDQMHALVVDETLEEVDPGQDGELVMTGPQLSLGYWQDEAKTRQAFVTPPGRNQIFYRTGDRVRRPSDGSPMIYLGRMDSQIKIMGHRVELGEIEAVVREETGIDGVVALGWPVTASGAGAVEIFLQTVIPLDFGALQRRIAARLPNYMVPRRFHPIAHLPLNSNSKCDRKALLRVLETLSP